MAFGTQEVPGYMIERFGEEVMVRVQLLPFGEGAFFLHTLRGTRGRSQHDPNNADEVVAALDDYLSIFNLEAMDVNEWWIDVALEYSCPDHVLHLRTDAHLHVVKEMLSLEGPRADHLASRLTSLGSSLYRRDSTAQLEQLSGFRLSPETAGRGTKIVYVNAYTTDKASTYLFDNGRFAKYITASEVLKIKSGADIPWVDRLKILYRTAAEQSDGHARLEIRVSLARAKTCLLSLSKQLLSRLLVKFTREAWKSVVFVTFHRV